MAATSATMPTSAAATWIWLAIVGATPGGSFGATPTTTAAIPAMPTKPLVLVRCRRVAAVSIVSTPTATIANRTGTANGWPGEASRLTVS
jgi:hypothetical protein